jgi:hypothetical protein
LKSIGVYFGISITVTKKSARRSLILKEGYAVDSYRLIATTPKMTTQAPSKTVVLEGSRPCLTVHYDVGNDQIGR